MRSLVRSSLIQVRTALDSEEVRPEPSCFSPCSGPDVTFGGGIETAGGGKDFGEDFNEPPLTTI